MFGNRESNKMFKRILVCVDGSDRSLAAARAGGTMAKALGAQVTVLHVCQLPSTPAPFPGAPELPAAALQGYVDALHDKVFERVRPVLEAEGVRCERIEEVGEPVATITRVAETQDFDLVVLGSRGLNAERAASLGSVSDGVAHRAHCPVLIVR
jgi:nucleotide-binding universal stress UspA family protein